LSKIIHVYQTIADLYGYAHLIHYPCYVYTALLISVLQSSWFNVSAHAEHNGKNIWRCFCIEVLNDTIS